LNYSDAKNRFIIASEIIKKYDIKGKQFLDVGCGIGNMILVAAQQGAKKAIGIDIDLNEFGETHFNTIAQENSIDLQNTELIEGSLGESIRFEDGEFDLITMQDVFEHLAQPTHILREVNRVLKHDGLLYISFTPLYYSPFGHHIFEDLFPRETMAWVHLYKDFYSEILPKTNVNQWLLRNFLCLNKMTLKEFKAIIKCCGFSIVSENIERSQESPEVFEERFRHLINMELVPDYQDLFIEGVNVTLKKTSICEVDDNLTPVDDINELYYLLEQLNSTKNITMMIPKNTRFSFIKRIINRILKITNVFQQSFNNSLVSFLERFIKSYSELKRREHELHIRVEKLEKKLAETLENDQSTSEI